MRQGSLDRNRFDRYQRMDEMRRTTGPFMTVTLLILAAVLVAYLMLVWGLYVAQRSLLYHPNGDRPRPGPGLAGSVSIEDVPSHDGLGLFSWWASPKDEDAPVLLYFHGNAGSQMDREERMAAFVARGWGVLMPAYRYNAGADGKPSEDALIADGRAALDWLLARGIASGRVVLFGESLGSGIATALAAEREDLAALVLDAPYDSVTDVAARLYWYVPVRLLLKDNFDSVARIGRVRIPVLIGHGGRDRVIPERHGRRLFEAANEPKLFAYKPDSGHVELFDYGFLDDIDAFFNQVVFSGRG